MILRQAGACVWVCVSLAAVDRLRRGCKRGRLRHIPSDFCCRREIANLLNPGTSNGFQFSVENATMKMLDAMRDIGR
jgi:hypothetical protein